MVKLLNQKKPQVFLVGLIIFYILFLTRFYLATLFFNNDFYSVLFWVKSLEKLGLNSFYSRDFSPWAQANYPPLINLLYLYIDRSARFIFGDSLSTPLLASFYKLPSLILETILITYLFIKRQKFMALFITLNPAIFYNTIFWGQTEGAVSSLVFFSILFLTQNQIILGLIFFTLALLTKQTAIVFIPVLMVIIFKAKAIKQIITGALLSALLIWVFFLPFNLQDWAFYPIKFFIENIGGQIHQHIASANALNLWFLLGFTETSDSKTFGLLSMRNLGNLFGYSLVVVISYKLYRFKKINLSEGLMAAALINFAAFLFFTRIHERYLFPSLIFMLPEVLKKKLSILVYLVVSFISFINLFWVWYYDHRLDASAYLTDSSLKFLALLNILCFVYFMIIFLKSRENHIEAPNEENS